MALIMHYTLEVIQAKPALQSERLFDGCNPTQVS